MSLLLLTVILFALIYFLVKELIHYFGLKRTLKIVEDYNDMHNPVNFYRLIAESIARDEKPIPYRLFTTENQKSIVDGLLRDEYLQLVVDENGEKAIDLTDNVLI